MLRVTLPLTAVAVLSAAACKKKEAGDPPPPPLGATGACPKEPDHRFAERYAVGTVPDHRVPGMGEASKCHAVFPDAPVFGSRTGADGKPEKFLASEGVFRGGCPDGDPHYYYEAVKIAKIDLDQPAPREYPAGKEFFLHVAAVDRCGFPLSHGLAGNARWTLGPGCETVVAPKAFDEKLPPAGFGAPGEEVMIAALAPGACTITVDFRGTRADFPITVK